MQVRAMQACLNIAERSLSYAKIMQARAMRVCSLIAERRLSYAKIMQARAMGACSLIAECSLSYAKIMQARAMGACLNIAERSLSYAKVAITTVTDDNNCKETGLRFCFLSSIATLALCQGTTQCSAAARASRCRGAWPAVPRSVVAACSLCAIETAAGKRETAR